MGSQSKKTPSIFFICILLLVAEGTQACQLINMCLFYFAKKEFLPTSHLEQLVELKHARNKQLSIHRMKYLRTKNLHSKAVVKKRKRLNCAN